MPTNPILGKTHDHLCCLFLAGKENEKVRHLRSVVATDRALAHELRREVDHLDKNLWQLQETDVKLEQLLSKDRKSGPKSSEMTGAATRFLKSGLLENRTTMDNMCHGHRFSWFWWVSK